MFIEYNHDISSCKQAVVTIIKKEVLRDGNMVHVSSKPLSEEIETPCGALETYFLS